MLSNIPSSLLLLDFDLIHNLTAWFLEFLLLIIDSLTVTWDLRCLGNIFALFLFLLFWVCTRDFLKRLISRWTLIPSHFYSKLSYMLRHDLESYFVTYKIIRIEICHGEYSSDTARALWPAVYVEYMAR